VLQSTAHLNSSKQATSSFRSFSARVWTLSFIYFSVIISFYGISLWLPQIVQSFSGMSDVDGRIRERDPVPCRGNLGGFAGPYLIGVVRSRTNSFTGALIVLALFPLAGAIVTLLLRNRTTAKRLPVTDRT
jgi:nitrate/nitrite transporter NarK